MVMVDDSHAVGFVGPTGAGTPELFGVQDRVDIVTGHARQGARRRVRRLRRGPRRDRRAAAAALASVPVLQRGRAVGRRRLAGGARPGGRQRRARARLRANTALFRAPDDRGGLRPAAGRAPDHAGHVRRRGASPAAIADAMLAHGVYVIAFSYPVVPRARPASASSCPPRTPTRTSRPACGRSSPRGPRPRACRS